MLYHEPCLNYNRPLGLTRSTPWCRQWLPHPPTRACVGVGVLERPWQHHQHPAVPHCEVEGGGEDVQLRAKAEQGAGELEDGQALGAAVTRRELVRPEVTLGDTRQSEVCRVRSADLQCGGVEGRLW